MLGPGAGVWIDSVSTLGGREPDIICGKPSVSLGKFMINRHELNPKTTCMVGDRLDTDVEFGRAAGFFTLFVESGTMTRNDAMNPSNSSLRTPDFVAPSVATLSEVLLCAAQEETAVRK
jgi:ribonucleotide monophosphatase NagD (HAD superfamily)